MLRARALQENVAAARRAAQANRLDEAARLYEQAIAASPDSAFLVRDLADVEAKQGKTDQALARYRRAIEMDPSDAASRIRIGEILDARGDLEGAHGDVHGGEQSRAERGAAPADGARSRRGSRICKLPAEYRAIPERPSITRGDLASLIGIRLAALVAARARAAGRHHRRAQPLGVGVDHGDGRRRRDGAVREPHVPAAQRGAGAAISRRRSARMLKIIAAGRPQLLKDWQSRAAEDGGCRRQQSALC